LNDLDWLFRAKICFRAGLAAWRRATSERNCVKTNKDRHILSAVWAIEINVATKKYVADALFLSGSWVSCYTPQRVAAANNIYKNAVLSQENRAMPQLLFADNIHYEFKSSQASKARFHRI